MFDNEFCQANRAGPGPAELLNVWGVSLRASATRARVGSRATLSRPAARRRGVAGIRFRTFSPARMPVSPVATGDRRTTGGRKPFAVEIVLHPHPDLRKRALPIGEVDSAVREAASEMVELMFAARGIGLAGNQVAWRRRLVVVCPTGERGEERVLVNPEVLEAEGEEIGEEGCLSFPQVFGRVPRAARIRYRYIDLDGNPVEREADGLEAARDRPPRRHRLHHANDPGGSAGDPQGCPGARASRPRAEGPWTGTLIHFPRG
jgi:peptide deformylase